MRETRRGLRELRHEDDRRRAVMAWSALAALAAWLLITVVAALLMSSASAAPVTSALVAVALLLPTLFAVGLLKENFPMAAVVCACGLVTAAALSSSSAMLMHLMFGRPAEATVVEVRCPPEPGSCVYRVAVAGADEQEPGWLYRWPHGQLEQGQRIEVSAVPGQWVQPVERDRTLSGIEQVSVAVAALAQLAALLAAVGAVVGRRSWLVNEIELWVER